MDPGRQMLLECEKTLKVNPGGQMVLDCEDPG